MRAEWSRHERAQSSTLDILQRLGEFTVTYSCKCTVYINTYCRGWMETVCMYEHRSLYYCTYVGGTSLERRENRPVPEMKTSLPPYV